MQEVKVICFYTSNTPYEQEVIHLQTSCKSFGIPIEVESKQSKGSWEKNIAMKPSFILEKLKNTRCPLLWVDADAVFLQKPNFSPFLEGDFAVRFMEIWKDKPEFAVSAGTIFINQTQEAKRLVRKWAERCQMLSKKKPPPFVDQIALFEILLENKKAKVFPLPISYCKIFDIDTFFINDEDVVIEHRQASRRYKCEV